MKTENRIPQTIDDIVREYKRVCVDLTLFAQIDLFAAEIDLFGADNDCGNFHENKKRNPSGPEKRKKNCKRTKKRTTNHEKTN